MSHVFVNNYGAMTSQPSKRWLMFTARCRDLNANKPGKCVKRILGAGANSSFTVSSLERGFVPFSFSSASSLVPLFYISVLALSSSVFIIYLCKGATVPHR